MTKLYLRDILRLDAVDSEAYHEVRDDLRLLFGISDDLYCLVDIEEDFFKSAQQMQLVLSLFEVEIGSASDALHAERNPLVEQLFDAHDAGRTGNQDIEVAGERIRERSEPVELLHELVGVSSPL